MQETKVLLIQNKITHYNLPVYNLLGKSPGIKLTIAHYDTNVKREEKFFNEIVWHVYKAGPLLISKENIRKICNEFDVVICLAEIHWLSHIMLGLRKKRNFKLIYWGIGVSASYKKKFDEKKQWDFLRFFIMKGADALIFYSSYPVRKYVEHGFRKETLFVANNTIQVNFKPEMDIEKDLILFIGTLYREKGIFELLTAYAEAYRETGDLPDLFMIGEGEESVNIKEWISQNKLDEKIKLKGAVYDYELLRQYFSRALATISPNQAGLSVLQSMGSGVPFITRSDSLTGGERFNIINNENGIIYNNRDELVNILCGMNKNKDLFKLMGLKARKFYESFRRPDQMVEGFLDAIRFVLNKKKTPSISEVYWINLPSVHDNRGILTSIESGIDIPFEMMRIFYMHHIVSERGGHAHTDTDQVVIAVSGSFTIELFDGNEKVNYVLDDPTKGLYVPRMIFIRLYDFSAGGVCQVLANTHYNIKKSIRNIDDYLKSL